MADPLSQLRQFHINGQRIEERNGFIIFGDYGWPKEVNTNYQVYATEDDKSKKEYYTLECLLYFLRNMDVTHAHYVKQAGQDKKPVVRRPDRNGLLAYLKGDSQTAPGIDKNAPIPAVRLSVVDINKRGQQHSTKDAGSNAGAHAFSSQAQAEHSRVSDPSPKKRLPHEDDISKVREEFAARLNEPSNKKLATIVPTAGIKETSENSAAISKFGAEKLASLRAKALAVKRTTINDADMEPGVVQSDPSGREDLLFAMDAEKYKLIKSKEKIWRTRTSILQSQSKNFSKSILGMVELLERHDDPNRKSTSHSLMPAPNDMPINPYHQTNAQAHQASQSANSRHAQYNRYDQERFVNKNLGVAIDTNVSLLGGMANGLPGQTLVGNTPVASRQPPSGPNVKNGTPHISRSHDKSATNMRPPSGLRKKKSDTPIIIIPATTTCLINMFNARAILQDLTYSDGKSTGRPRESEMMIERHKPDGSVAMYKIVDNPVRFDREDWNRVVAVFVQGPAWQFKGWPWEGSPTEIFSRIKGFHLKWDETKLDDNVAKWNVHILELSRTRRHLDKANLLKFWSSLDAYMAKYKSFLKF